MVSNGTSGPLIINGSSPLINTSHHEIWNQPLIRRQDYFQYPPTIDDAPVDSWGNYYYMEYTCKQEDYGLAQEVLSRSYSSRPRYLWPVIAAHSSFRMSRMWEDVRSRENHLKYPHRQISKLDTSPWFIIFLFIVMFVIFLGLTLLVFFFIFMPVALGICFVVYFLHRLLTFHCCRDTLRSIVIWWLKLMTRLEVARTPDGYQLDHHYVLPTFLQKDDDDEYPAELEEFDLYYKRKHNRLDIYDFNVTERFAHYMDQQGLVYDSTVRRFTVRDESVDKPPEPADAEQLKEERVKQARALLAQERDYILSIPEYRLLAIELNIPYKEDIDNAVVISTARQLAKSNTKVKPSNFNLTLGVPTKKKSIRKSPARTKAATQGQTDQNPEK